MGGEGGERERERTHHTVTKKRRGEGGI